MLNSYKDLHVWKKSLELVKEIYSLTEKFPKEEIFGLTSQMRRSAVSVPSNIAEGRSRGTRKDFIQFLRIALGSATELQTQLEITKILPKTSSISVESSEKNLVEIIKMLHGMIRKLSEPKANS
jgi:four helix bundle protein